MSNFNENNDTINLWSSCDDSSGAVNPPFSLEEPSPSVMMLGAEKLTPGLEISKIAPFLSNEGFFFPEFFSIFLN